MARGIGFEVCITMEERRESAFRFLDDPEKRKILTKAGVAGLVVVAVAFLVLIVNSSSYPDELYIDSVATPVATQVRQIKMDRPYYNKRVQTKTVDFYKRNNGKTRWLEYKKPTKFYSTYVASIKDAARYGLDPNHYDLETIVNAVDSLYENNKRKPEDVAALDVKITASFLLFTTHLIEGRIRTAGYGDFIWEKNIPNEDDVDLLLANSSGKLSDIIEELHPDVDQYERMEKALRDYRTIEDKFRIRLTGKSGAIKPGTKDAAIPGIRRRLSLTDVKPYSPEDSLFYDDKLEDAVKQFQLRHGLEQDGIISTATLAYLNQSFGKKADLIELNLERLRWLPREQADDYIYINIPEYLLRLYKNGKEKLEMRVVLGTEFTSTPVFTDTLEYIVFSPTWNVPTSILEEEFLPKLQEDPNVFDPERFMILKNGQKIEPEDVDWEDKDLNIEEYRMVENPGEMNSLGRVKFMMPNNFNIYLHDTPAEKLFQKNKRAYSHGCVRLERPIDLAKFLLDESGEKWTDEEISEAMQKEEPVNVPLKKKYPVQIEYRTVWVDDDGLVHFREDLYDHDQRHITMLKKID